MCVGGGGGRFGPLTGRGLNGAESETFKTTDSFTETALVVLVHSCEDERVYITSS